MSSSTSTVRLAVRWWWGRREGADDREKNIFQNILNIHSNVGQCHLALVWWWWERREAAGKLFPKLEKYREKGDRVRSRHTKLLLHKPRKQESGFVLALGLSCESH